MANKRGEVKKLLEDMGNEKLETMYEEFGQLQSMAKFLNISLEALRKHFKKHNISYETGKYDVNDNFFDDDNELSFYWAGFIAADGNVDSKKPRISIKLHQDDVWHLQKLAKTIETDAPVIVGEREDSRFENKIYKYCGLRFTSAQIANSLKRFGITPKKSKTYQIPISIIEHGLFHHFLRGIIDGDGWINDGSVGLCGSAQCIEITAKALADKEVIDPLKINIKNINHQKYVARWNVYCNLLYIS